MPKFITAFLLVFRKIQVALDVWIKTEVVILMWKEIGN